MIQYKRILIKLSGGAVAGSNEFGFDPARLEHIAKEILSVIEMGIEVSIVIGGGNIFRGNMADYWGIERAEADNIGTLATVINSLMLRGVLKQKTGKEVRVMSSIPVSAVAEPYIRLRAIHHLEKGYIVIFAGGNGQPYVTTDYPSVQRALEVNCDAILVAKQGVDGVMDGDPRTNPHANTYVSLPYNEVLNKNLKVMDQSAFILARDFKLPVFVFNFDKTGAMKAICEGQTEGTAIFDGAPIQMDAKGTHADTKQISSRP
ncbi:UMP kinase [Paenibacillus radicis (ex Xue et al. 2023)]|uniref:Uridylate kinase n=1 Tax=Paenibacillus radicis (ex Xue et al. 2023) TaxID=2972489 RepID=A0ABT1YF12_9BACL|nr:UMP kinase [Paenibacillus radicis (ex Xue et al. 2023)]MCR8631761.1 UMP kinase [Paenibacillus radicis (ex Xue et al. 2023)]